MGAIAGVLLLTGEPVRRQDLEAMSEVLAHRGPGAHGVFCDGAVGLVWRGAVRAGDERGRRDRAADAPVIAAEARLDNRRELAHLLEVGEAGDDLRLLEAAYRRWGEHCAERLIGDFAFAVWDPARRRLLCAVDHLGMRPLYYAHLPGVAFAFASEIKALRGLPLVSDRPDEARIADFLVELPHDGTSTFYRDVTRLGAAHCLLVERAELRLRRYWSLQPRDLPEVDDGAYEEQFREHFSRAVADRLPAGAPCAAMLSGGLDSSSVVCAARDLRARGAVSDGFPLHTLALVSDEPGYDERPWIAAVLADGELVHHEIPCDDLDPLADLDAVLRQQDEPFEFMNLHLLRKLYATAAELGLRTVLDGYHGDAVVSHGTAWLGELVARLRLRRFAVEFAALTRGQGGRARLLWQLGLRPLLPRAVRGLRARRLLARRRELLGPDLARRTAARHRARLEQLVRGLPPPDERRRHAAEVVSADSVHFLGQVDRAAAAFSVEPRSPFYDRRLVELCVSLPPDQKLRQGWTRSIQRRALAGLLPEPVRAQRFKLPAPASLARALARDGGARLDGLLCGPALRDLLDHETVDAMRRRYLENRALGDALHVWRLAVLSAWLQADGG